MDPMCPYDIKSRESISGFQQLSKALELKGQYNDEKHFPLLKHKPCPIKNAPKQIDGVNCGIYIIYYAYTVMDKSGFSSEFDPNNYRNYRY